MKRIWKILLGLFLLLLLIGVFFGFRILDFGNWISFQPKVETIKEAKPLSQETPTGEKVTRRLYFSFEDKLFPEDREIWPPLRSDLTAQIRILLEELIKGPVSDLRLTPTLPREAKLRGIFIDKNGICYLDFGREIQEGLPGGVWTEMLCLYSIVNTLTTNLPEIKGVQFLVMGSEIETLTGHIYCRYPLYYREDLIVQ